MTRRMARSRVGSLWQGAIRHTLTRYVGIDHERKDRVMKGCHTYLAPYITSALQHRREYLAHNDAMFVEDRLKIIVSKCTPLVYERRDAL
jgi:hypothetical protein